MTTALSRLRQLFLSISGDQATLARRGFQVDGERLQRHLEAIGQVFIRGYNLALRETRPHVLAARLDREIDRDQIGFAFEGAAMGLAVLDHLAPWMRSRFSAFLRGPGERHAYMVHVGAGWAVARVPWLQYRFDRYFSRLDPLLRWLVIDGYGFHQGFFHARRYVVGQSVPAFLSGYQRRAFDQGLGRSLWFVCGASVRRISDSIGGFPSSRQSDLWSGVGLACGYAGGLELHELETLVEAAGTRLPQLAQGAAFAAKARLRAGNPTTDTRRACETLCGLSVEKAARVTDFSLPQSVADDSQPAYERWRQAIQQHFAGRTATTRRGAP